jgi:hypothetical protein
MQDVQQHRTQKQQAALDYLNRMLKAHTLCPFRSSPALWRDLRWWPVAGGVCVGGKGTR